MMKKNLFILIAGLFLVGCAFSGGNFVGEAVVAKETKEQLKYIDLTLWEGIGKDTLEIAFKDENGNVIEGSTTPHGEAFLNKLNFNIFNFFYSLKNQNAVLSLSVPFALPSELGLRLADVQWIDNFYFGISAAVILGYYKNYQNKEEGRVYTTGNKFDVFPLWSLGMGGLFDITSKISLGGYAIWERVAVNSGGYEFRFISSSNYPPYSYRKNIFTLGTNLIYKNIGFYLEYAPKYFLINDNWTKIKLGILIFY